MKQPLRIALLGGVIVLVAIAGFNVLPANAIIKLNVNIKRLSEKIMGRSLVIVPAEQKLQELQSELIIQRSLRTMALTGSSWTTYKRKDGEFPAFQAVPPSYNKMNIDWTKVNYSDVKNFVVKAMDDSEFNKPKILVPPAFRDVNEWGLFFIQDHYDSGDYLYGPFFDDLDRLVSEVNVVYPIK